MSTKTDRPFTMFYNDLLDAAESACLGGREYQVFLVILRETIGHHRDEAQIKLGGFRDRCHFTGSNDNSIRHNVMRVVESLQTKKVIIVRQLPGVPGFYRINENVDEWVTCNTEDTCNVQVTCNSEDTCNVQVTCNSEDTRNRNSGVTCNGNVQVTGLSETPLFKEKERNSKDTQTPGPSNIQPEKEETVTPRGCKWCKPLNGNEQGRIVLIKRMHDAWRELYPNAPCHCMTGTDALSNIHKGSVKIDDIVLVWRWWLKNADTFDADNGYSIKTFCGKYHVLAPKAQPKPTQPTESQHDFIERRMREMLDADPTLDEYDRRSIAYREWRELERGGLAYAS